MILILSKHLNNCSVWIILIMLISRYDDNELVLEKLVKKIEKPRSWALSIRWMSVSIWGFSILQKWVR